MDRLYATCCGLDVHQASVVACLLRQTGDAAGRAGRASGQRTKEIRSFETTTAGLLALRDWLLALRDWLLAAGCTHVAMEGTGVYWKQS